MAATKFIGAEAPVTQPTPDELFCPRLFLAQGAGAFDVGHGGSVGNPRELEKNGVNVRPHPGPTALPPEKKEKPPRVFLSCEYGKWMSDNSHEKPRCNAGRKNVKTSDGRCQMFPLLGGENSPSQGSRFEPLNWRCRISGSGMGVPPVRIETHGRDARATRFMGRVRVRASNFQTELRQTITVEIQMTV